MQEGGEAESGLVWWKIFRLFASRTFTFGPTLRVSLSLIPSNFIHYHSTCRITAATTTLRRSALSLPIGAFGDPANDPFSYGPSRSL